MPSSDHTVRSKRGTLSVASFATALVLVVFTVPITTLSATTHAFSASAQAQAWILSAMSVGAAAGLMGSGAIGDDYGRRRVFLAGTVLLALSSFVGAFAPNVWVLVAVRLLQGLGGAAIMSCGLGLIGQAFRDKELGGATAIWAAALGAGVAIGPILSSGLVALGGWQAPYWASAVASTILLIAGRLVLSESRSNTPRKIDYTGTVLLSLAVTSFLAGLTQSRSMGNAYVVSLLLVCAVLLLTCFLFVEARTTAPMLDLRLFKRPDFTGATFAAFASGAGVLSLMSMVPTILERALEVSPLQTAYVLLAWSATSSVSAMLIKWVSLPPRTLLIGGLAACGLGQLSLYGLQPDSWFYHLIPGMFFSGAANGVLNAALGRQAVASVPLEKVQWAAERITPRATLAPQQG